MIESITESSALHLALAHNSICLVSNIPAFQEFFLRYGCVELFDLHSESDLINKIKNLLSKHLKKLEIMQNQQSFLAETGWKKIALRTMEVYKSVIS